MLPFSNRWPLALDLISNLEPLDNSKPDRICPQKFDRPDHVVITGSVNRVCSFHQSAPGSKEGDRLALEVCPRLFFFAHVVDGALE